MPGYATTGNFRYLRAKHDLVHFGVAVGKDDGLASLGELEVGVQSLIAAVFIGPDDEVAAGLEGGAGREFPFGKDVGVVGEAIPGQVEVGFAKII